MSFTTADIPALVKAAPHAATRDALTAAMKTAPAKAPEPNKGGRSAAAKAFAKSGEQMSKTEAAYARRLDIEKAAGAVIDFGYETDRLKLADGIEGGKSKWFCVDFTVIAADGHTIYDEVKGRWHSDAGIERFRWLCQNYPRRHFRLWKYEGQAWRLRLESDGRTS